MSAAAFSELFSSSLSSFMSCAGPERRGAFPYVASSVCDDLRTAMSVTAQRNSPQLLSLQLEG